MLPIHQSYYYFLRQTSLESVSKWLLGMDSYERRPRLDSEPFIKAFRGKLGAINVVIAEVFCVFGFVI